jgi:hypothetical protein
LMTARPREQNFLTVTHNKPENYSSMHCQSGSPDRDNNQ